MLKIKQLPDIKLTTAGIYAIKYVDTGMVVYIGKDKHLTSNQRLKDHLRIASKSSLNIAKEPSTLEKVLLKTPDNFIYQQLLFCDLKDLEFLEDKLILALKPILNYHQLESQSRNRADANKFMMGLIERYNLTDYETNKLLSILGLYSSF